MPFVYSRVAFEYCKEMHSPSHLSFASYHPHLL